MLMRWMPRKGIPLSMSVWFANHASAIPSRGGRFFALPERHLGDFFRLSDGCKRDQDRLAIG